MSAESGTCEYVLDPSDPTTWDDEEGAECHVYKDAVNDDREWRCPHDAEAGNRLCIFHRPVEDKDDDAVIDAFLEAVDEATTDDGVTTHGRCLEFLGARFGSFELSERATELTLRQGVIKMTHATIGGPFDWSEAAIDGSLRLNAITCADDVSFSNAEINGDVEFKWAEIRGEMKVRQGSFGGSSTFYKTTFDGDADYRHAAFERDSDFLEATFQAEVDFSQAVFDRNANFRNVKLAAGAEFYETEFQGDAEFTKAEFGGEGNFFKADFGSAASFFGSDFQGNADFKSVAFGDGAEFNGAAFCEYGDFGGAVFDGETIFNNADFTKESFHDPSFQGAEFMGETKFRDVEFSGVPNFLLAEFTTRVDFTDSEFHDDVNFRDVTFGGAAEFARVTFGGKAEFLSSEFAHGEFEECDISGCDFTGADLGGANLSEVTAHDATFHQAHLESANLERADLSGANLERAKLSNADLFGADLSGVHLYGIRIGDAAINTETVFDRHSNNRCVYDPSADYAYDSDDENVDRLTKAMGAYQALEKLCSENALPDAEGTFFVRRQDMLRRQRRVNGEWGQWMRSWASNLVVRYGESPWRVVGSTAIAVLLCAAVYPLAGIRTGGEVVTYRTAETTLQPFLDSLYFSVVTFTTLGYGDVQPVGFARVVATLETIAGSALLALLVFVFGRRATR